MVCHTAFHPACDRSPDQDPARGLIRAIRREPSRGQSLAGAALARGAELVADVVGLAGGARGNRKVLRQLLIESEDALGAFAIVEQLGYAIGLPELPTRPCEPVAVRLAASRGEFR
jgi:hypothetical protein